MDETRERKKWSLNEKKKKMENGKRFGGVLSIDRISVGNSMKTFVDLSIPLNRCLIGLCNIFHLQLDSDVFFLNLR